MVRTVVSLDPEDKAWLDRKAQEEHLAMAEVVRRAIHLYRQHEETAQEATLRLLQKTAGIWSQGDGLEYQQRLRDEWER